MFEGFSPAAGEFLWDLRFNNERPWFQENKGRFISAVDTPMKQLAADTLKIMQQRHPELELQLHVSRIYRDARRLFGRGPYKERLWFSLKNANISGEGPVFWFELAASEYSYGMGFYGASPREMEVFRNCVKANPAEFLGLVRGLEAAGGFSLTGEEYKRLKGDMGPEINPWYNRKRIGIERCYDFGGELFEARLPEILADCYEQLLPMYRYFIRFYNMAQNN